MVTGNITIKLYGCKKLDTRSINQCLDMLAFEDKRRLAEEHPCNILRRRRENMLKKAEKASAAREPRMNI